MQEPRGLQGLHEKAWLENELIVQSESLGKVAGSSVLYTRHGVRHGVRLVKGTGSGL